MAGLHFPITGDNSNFIEALDGVKRNIKSTTETVEKSGLEIEQIFDRLKTSALAFGASFGAKEIINNVVQIRGQFQQLEVAFTTMLGSAEKANVLMNQLTKTAAVTPFGLQDVANGAKQLLAFGVSAEKVNETLVRLGDISAGLSIPLGDLVYLYGTTMTQGRLFTQDLRQFMGRGIPLADELAKQFGIAKDAVGEYVTAGKVGFAEVEKAIVSMTSEGGKFGGLMEAQSKTIIGQISNIEDAIDSMFNELGKSSEGVINSVLGGVSTLVENYEEVGKAIGAVVTGYGAYKAALMTVAAIEQYKQKILLETQRIQAINYAQGIQQSEAEVLAAARKNVLTNANNKLALSLKKVASATLLNPYAWLGAAVAALTYGIYKLVTYESELEKTQNKINDAFASSQSEIASEMSKLNRLKGSLEGATKGTTAYNDAKNELINSFSKYDSKLKKEIEEIGFTEEAYKKLTIAINESISARHMSSTIKDIDDDYGKTFGDNINNLYDRLTKKLGSEKGSKIYEKIKEQLFSGELSIGDRTIEDYNGRKISRAYNIKGLDKEVKDALDEISGRANNDIFINASAEKYIYDILQAQKRRDEAIKKTRTKFGNINTKTGTGSKDENIEVQNKAYWEKIKKEAEEEYNALTVVELKTKEALKIRKRIAEAERMISLYDTKKGKDKKISFSIIDEEIKNDEARIDLMEDGFAKRIASIELNYNKEIATIRKNKEKLKSEQNGILTDEQSAVFTEAENLALSKRDKELKKEKDARLKTDVEYWQEYFAKYGNYQEQRMALEAKYNADIAQAQKDGLDGRIAILEAELNSELSTLDEKFGLSTSSMADLFEDAGQKSINAIQKIIDKYELLVSFRTSGNGVTREDLFNVGISEKDLESIEQGTINLKDITEAIKSLKGEIGTRSPFKQFSEDIKKSVDNIKNGKMGEGIDGIGNAVSSFTSELSGFSSNLSNILGKDDSEVQSAIQAVGGLGQTAAGVGQIMSGDVLGGVMNAVKGISAMVDALDGMFGADYSEYNKLKEEYEGLISIWDELISKKTEYIDIRYGTESQQVGKEAIDMLKREIELTKELGEKRLASGASAGSHSIAYRQKDRMDSKDWQEAYDAIGWDRSRSMYDLFELSAEQLEKLKDKAPGFWLNLDEDVREYLQKIIDCEDEIDKMGEKMKEAATGVSFDGFYDNFVSALTDMSATAEDIADDISDYFFKSMLSNFVADKLKTRLKKFYDDWAADMEDGRLDTDIDSYRNEYQNIISEGIAERNALADITGYGTDSYSQEASSKGFQAMSQDSADELNGRFTALQMAGEEIRNNMIIAVTHLGGLYTVSSTLLTQIRDSMMISNSFLEDIAAYSKSMLSYGVKLDTIIENTNSLR